MTTRVLPPNSGPPGAFVISSVRVEAVGGHDHVTVFNRGANAGTLIVQRGDGENVSRWLMGDGIVEGVEAAK